MPDFLADTADAYVNVSPGFVETLIHSRREELFTGVMRLRYPEREMFAFTFVEGVQQKLYRYFDKNTEVIQRQSWVNSLDRPDASVGFLPMSFESLRLMQVAHEAPILRVDEHIFTLPQLTEQVKTWAAATEPAVLNIRAEKQFNRIYLMSGISNPVIEEVSFVDGSPSFSVNDSFFPSFLPSLDIFQVTRYVSDVEHDTWQEHELRLAFNPLMRLLLNRFSELAGRMLTERLCTQISSWLRAEGWNIKVTINGVSNHQLFESVEQAVDTCVGIIRSFQEEASPAIGLRMAEGLSRDMLFKLDPYRRDTLIRHIYNENRLDAVTGKVWR
jgi:hypothetical protein